MDKIGNLFEREIHKKVVVFNQKLHSNTLEQTEFFTKTLFLISLILDSK